MLAESRELIDKYHQYFNNAVYNYVGGNNIDTYNVHNCENSSTNITTDNDCDRASHRAKNHSSQ